MKSEARMDTCTITVVKIEKIGKRNISHTYYMANEGISTMVN